MIHVESFEFFKALRKKALIMGYLKLIFGGLVSDLEQSPTWKGV